MLQITNQLKLAIIPTVTFLYLLMFTLAVRHVHAVTPFDSGNDHGCSDAKISDSSDRYINQPENGSSSHSLEFMDGYNAGFDACFNQDNGREGNSESQHIRHLQFSNQNSR